MEGVRERSGRPLRDLWVETVCCGGTPIVRCRGRLVYGVTTRYLRARVAHLIQRHRHVTLDLTGLTHLDACGVGALAGLIGLARRSRGQLVFAAPAGRVRYLLHLTRLDTQVDVVSLEKLYDGWRSPSVSGSDAYDNAARIA